MIWSPIPLYLLFASEAQVFFEIPQWRHWSERRYRDTTADQSWGSWGRTSRILPFRVHGEHCGTGKVHRLLQLLYSRGWSLTSHDAFSNYRTAPTLMRTSGGTYLWRVCHPRVRVSEATPFHRHLALHRCWMLSVWFGMPWYDKNEDGRGSFLSGCRQSGLCCAASTLACNLLGALIWLWGTSLQTILISGLGIPSALHESAHARARR